MAIELEIKDGNPWYLSPDIWTVPGEDPEGPPGTPIAGQPCYLWARVRNNGNTTAQNATVRFYWANPAVGFDRTTANLIGTAYVTLAGGETKDVLCLTPWVPAFVNQGHECVLAEAFHSADPLPTAPAFNVPTDRHVAQRNLSVLQTATRTFHLAFEVHNPSRKARSIALYSKVGGLPELKALLPRFKGHVGDGRVLGLGFARTACPREEEVKHAEEKLELRLAPGERAGLSLVGELDSDTAVIHVTQEDQGVITGGLAVLVQRRREEKS